MIRFEKYKNEILEAVEDVETESCDLCIHNCAGKDEYPCVECVVRYLNHFKPGLKPCPFCGGIPSIDMTHTTEEVWIECTGCHTEQPLYASVEEAIDNWNRRV